MKSFVKTTSKVEVLGLQELALAGVKIPEIFSFSQDKLRLEYIETVFPKKLYWQNLGIALSKIHQVQKPVFGWKQNGFIGKNPQINTQEKTWSDFFWNHRLQFQFSLLKQKQFFNADFDNLFQRAQKRIVELLSAVTEPPCLLHGDLWIGNVLCNNAQDPVFIDPSVYYGHRETDLAMMKLFGGFSDVTFDAYQEQLPLLAGWEEREKIYQLYHVMNHANLFGAGYVLQAKDLLRNFV